MSNVAAPPMAVGQLHPNNNHVARAHEHHGLVWDLPDHKKKKEDAEILQMGRQWLQSQPPAAHDTIRGFVNTVLKNPDRHIRHGSDSPSGPEMVRSRHLKLLFQNDPSAKLEFHPPSSLTFNVARHGTNPKVSQFRYDHQNSVAKSESLWYDGDEAYYVDEDGHRYRFSSRTGGLYTGFGAPSSESQDALVKYEGADHGSKLARIRALSLLLRSPDSDGLSGAGSDAGNNESLSRDQSQLLKAARSELLSQHFENLVKNKGKFVSNNTTPKTAYTQKEWYNKSKKDKKAIVHAQMNPNPADKIPLKDSIAEAAKSIFGDRVKKEELGKTHMGGTASPKPSHTIATLQNLEREGWRNGNTGYEMSAEEGTHDLHQKLQNKADKQVKRSLRDIYKPKAPTTGQGPEDFFGKNEDLEKSKNVRQQRAKVFGTSGEPSPDKKSTKGFHAKQSAALNQVAQKRYGVELAPASGKMNYTVPKLNRERKKAGQEPMTEEQVRSSPDFEFANQNVTSPQEHNNFRPKKQKSNPKPDWRSGKLEAQRHVAAQAHEMGHLETMPENVPLGDAQTLMDVGTSTVGKKFGAAAKQTQYEIQPMAAEEALRRRAGIPQFNRPQRTDPRRGMSSVPLSEESPARVSLDTKEPYATRLKDDEGLKDLIGSGKNLSPENKQRMKDVDEGIMNFNPGEGWTQSNSSNALINLRGQGRHREAVERLKGKYAKKSELTKSDNGNKDWHESYNMHAKQPNKLVHYSKQQGLKHLDPTFQGTATKGAESKYGKPAVPRTYYYEHGSQPEDIVKQGAKAKYTATLQPHQRIYDLGHDRDGIYNKLHEASKNSQFNAGIVTDDDYLGAVRDAGYHGFKNSKGALPNAVALFHSHPVDTESSPFEEGNVHEKVS